MRAFDVLKQSPLFAGVERAALRQMADALMAGEWPKRSEIPIASETAPRLTIVVEGRVKIIGPKPRDGREMTLWLLGPGDAFDVVSLLDGEQHCVCARALDDVRVLSVPVSVFHQWLERYPSLRLSVDRYIAVRSREVTQLARSLALHDVKTRLAVLLLRHVDDSRKSRPAKPGLIRDLPHEELAFLIGSVRVVVSRLLGQLKRAGIVDFHRDGLRVSNPKRLLRTSRGGGRLSN